MSAEEEVLQRLAVIETEMKNHSEKVESNHSLILNSLSELKQGLGIRVEKHGEDIAVLKNQVEDLQGAKKWIVTSIVGAFISGLWGMFKK